MKKSYIAIDLKSFYASVENVVRSLDPLDTNLVVADESRSDKTICLAVSPAMKLYGLPGRCRLFEVRGKIRQVNEERKRRLGGKDFTGKSFSYKELQNNPFLELDCVIAPPQMAKYIEVSSRIYEIYLGFVSKDDIHVYSIDEVFIDVTPYLGMYKMSARELAVTIIRKVLSETGITATAGVGTNLYLAKIAMDIVAKHIPADEDGVRIAELDEMSFRTQLWNHQPLIDFWRIGSGIQNHLHRLGIKTMGDLARASVASLNSTMNMNVLYKEFGINAELLIDHAWGVEPCTIRDIKNYKSKNKSLSQGQVLPCPYSYEKMRIIVKEMADNLALELQEKMLVAGGVALYIGYDSENFRTEAIKPVQGRMSFPHPLSASSVIAQYSLRIFEVVANHNLTFRRISICAVPVFSVEAENDFSCYKQGEFVFDDEEQKAKSDLLLLEDKQRRVQQAILDMKGRFGKNAVIKAVSLEEGAMQVQRNNQIGGHKA